MKDVLPETVRPAFNLNAWLAEREKKPEHVVVELGHGARPLALVRDFEDGHVYIGIEARINSFHYGNTADQIIGRLLTQKAQQNIFFIEQHVNTGHRRVDDTKTILPDSAADEVFIRNVIGDPSLGSEEEVKKVFTEAARLVTSGGNVVISENNTPYDPARARLAAEEVGLSVLAEIHPDNSSWQELQLQYVTEQNRNYWSDFSVVTF